MSLLLLTTSANSKYTDTLLCVSEASSFSSMAPMSVKISLRHIEFLQYTSIQNIHIQDIITKNKSTLETITLCFWCLIVYTNKVCTKFYYRFFKKILCLRTSLGFNIKLVFCVCSKCVSEKFITFETQVPTISLSQCAKCKESRLLHFGMNNAGFGKVIQKHHSAKFSQEVHIVLWNKIKNFGCDMLRCNT